MANEKDPMSDPTKRQERAEEALRDLEEAIIHSPQNGGIDRKKGEEKDGDKKDNTP